MIEMKVFIIPQAGSKEWKLKDFHTNEKWRNVITKDQLEELDMIPMGGEVSIQGLMGKPIIIMRIL